MRLIDADALRDELIDLWMRYVNNGIPMACSAMTDRIDAAPPVRCAECEYHEDGCCLHPEMVTYPPPDMVGDNFIPPTIDFGCVYFERKAT